MAKERKKDITIIALLLIIIGMHLYYNVYQVNTAIKLHQEMGMHDLTHEQVQDLYYEENKDYFKEEDYKKYKELIDSPFGPSSVQQFVVFNYEQKDQKIVIEVSPGIKRMLILDIQIEEE